jgi:hypothetical protein
VHRTITGILRKIREIEASSMSVETLWGYNLYRPPCCNSKTRDHKQASIFDFKTSKREKPQQRAGTQRVQAQQPGTI